MQSFRRQPALLELAPTQTEASFLFAQVLLLAVFLWFATSLMQRFTREALARG